MSSSLNFNRLDLRKFTEEFGLVLQLNSGANYLQCSTIQFTQKLNNRLMANGRPNAKLCEAYMKALEDEVFSKPPRFENALGPTAVKLSADDFESGPKESYLRLLLHVEALQPLVMMRLLEKLAELAEDPLLRKEFRSDIRTALLSLFRFLDFVVDSETVCHKIFEIVGLLEGSLQRELISLLPEILNDNQHESAASHLKDLLQEKPALMDCILDALNYLLISEKLAVSLDDIVMKSLVDVPSTLFPAILKFLLQSATADTAGEVMASIRANFDMANMKATKQPGSNSSATTKIPPELSLSVFDTLKREISRKPFLAPAAYKHLDKLPPDQKFKLFDLWLVLILQILEKISGKLLDSLLRKKIRCGSIDEKLIEKSFQGQHSLVSQQMFRQWMALINVLMRSIEDSIVPVCDCIYRQCFITLVEDRYAVVSCLMEHVDSGLDMEIDFALDIFKELVENHHDQMALLSSYIPPMLDILQTLNSSQIRKLMHIFSRLAYSSNDEGSFIKDDLLMCLTKYMTCGQEPQKSTGIVGTVKVVEELLCLRSPGADVSHDIKTLIELLNCHTKSSATKAQFYDEVADMCSVKEIDPNVLAKVVEPILKQFHEHCILEKGNMVNSLQHLPIDYEISYNLASLDVDIDESICINILSVVCDGDNQMDFSMAMCPAFRLLLNCENKKYGNLDRLDSIIRAPLLLCKKSCFVDFSALNSKEKRLACLTAYHGCNWLRELINALSSVNHPDVFKRLRHLVELQDCFERGVEGTSSFTVPSARVDSSGKADWVLKAYKKPKRKVATVAVSKGKVVDKNASVLTFDEVSGFPRVKQSSNSAGQAANQVDDEDMESSRSESQAENTQKVDPTDKSRTTFRVADHLDIFRELDIDVLNLLKNPLNTSMEVTVDGELKPKELEFLLLDLERKLIHSVKSSLKRNTFGNAKIQRGFDHLDTVPQELVINKLFETVGFLKQHLDRISGYFATIQEKNDGIVDSAEMYSDNSAALTECLRLILACITVELSWIGFKKEEHRDKLLQLMSSFTGDDVTQDADISNNFLDLLLKLENFMITVDIAGGLLKLLTVVAEFDIPDGRKTQIAELANRFLKKEWQSVEGVKEKGPKFQENLSLLISSRVKFVKSICRLTALEALARHSLVEAQDNENLASTTYKTLNRQTFPVYFKVIMAELMAATQTRAPNGGLNEFEKWVMSLKIFAALVNIAKKPPPTRSNSIVTLRAAPKYLDLLVKDLMPVLDDIFKEYHQDITIFLNKLRTMTGHIGHICSHYQVQKVKDPTILQYIPQCKKNCEVLAQRVRVTLALNNCAAAFWKGTLKNKDLEGNLISSQVPQSVGEEYEGVGDEEDSEDEDEEMVGPSDKDSDADETEDGRFSPIANEHSPPDSTVSGISDSDDMSEMY